MSSDHPDPIKCSCTEQERSLPPFTDVETALLSMQEIVGRKWQPIIVHQLLVAGPSGFSSLKNDIDRISSKMLSESLDRLEAAGLVDRTLLSDQPVRVEYALTERGQALEPLVTEMVNWAEEHDVGTTADESAAVDESGQPQLAQLCAEGE